MGVRMQVNNLMDAISADMSRNCDKHPQGRGCPDNGLLLSSLWDAAFDAGLVAFGDKWEVLLSPILSLSAIDALGLNVPRYLPEQYRNPRREQYLAYHRAVVFKA